MQALEETKELQVLQTELGPMKAQVQSLEETRQMLVEECHHLCWQLEREVPHCYVRLLRGSRETIPTVVIDSLGEQVKGELQLCSLFPVWIAYSSSPVA